MKLDECLLSAGLRELRAFTDAWQIDVVKRDDPAEYIEKVLGSAAVMRDSSTVDRHLSLLTDLPYRAQMLTKSALRQLLNQPDYAVVIDDFHALMIEQERQFVEWASRPNALKHLDAKVVDIYRTVLEAAWEDNVNSFEFRLLERLRAKLGLTRRDHRVIELQIGKFPSVSGGPHTTSEIEEAVRELIKRGLAMRLMVGGRRLYAIPEELAVTIRDRMGIELTSSAYVNLLQHLPVSILRTALENSGQPFSGARDFLTARIIDGYVSPKFVLRQLSDDQLQQLLLDFPLVRQEGSREIRIRNLVRHFDQLSFAPEVPAERRVDTYVSYYSDLASRNYAVLRAAGVASKDRDVERAFEAATIAIFADYLGYSPERMDGSRHADGKVIVGDGQRVLLWDCKSCESQYTLTDRLARQFLSYCVDAAPLVASPMLVIAPAFSGESADTVQKLKVQCPPGTEIALVEADTLLWLARYWRQRRGGSAATRLPWQVLATTGLLDQATLTKRLKTFASTG